MSDTGALAGLHVVEVLPGFGAYAGKLLADLGADVVCFVAGSDDLPVLLADRDPAGRLVDFVGEFHRSGKRYRVAGDLSAAPARATIAEALATADVLITGSRASELDACGLAPQQTLERYPRLVHLSVTGFGLRGPRADEPFDDLTVLAAGGLLSLAGDPASAPVRPYGRQAEVAASLHGAVGALVAVREAERTGAGQLVDVSAQDAVAHSLENAAQFFDLVGHVRTRIGGDELHAGTGVYRCADGFVYLMTAMNGELLRWEEFVAWMAANGVDCDELRRPEWLDMAFRYTTEARTAFRELFERFAGGRAKFDLYLEGQAAAVNIAPVSDALDLLCSEQLAVREFFVQDSAMSARGVTFPGAPYRLSATPAVVTMATVA